MKTKNVKDVERIEVMENLVDTLAPHIFGQDSENPRLCPDCSGGKITLKSFESGSLVEWRTDVHCSVHVVRLTVDPRSLSSCHHEPSFDLDPQKPRVNGLSLVQGGDLRSHG